MEYTNPLSHITMDGTTMDIKDAQASAAVTELDTTLTAEITSLKESTDQKFTEHAAAIAQNTAQLKVIAVNQWVSVLDYGADRTGTEDSTQAFIDAIAATPVHGTVYIPIGEYMISNTIDVKKPITILGDYVGLDVEYASSAATSDEYKRPLIHSYCQNIPTFEIYGGGIRLQNIGIWQRVENGGRIISISRGSGSATVARNNYFSNIWVNGNYGGSTYAAIALGTNSCNLITTTFEYCRFVFVQYGFVIGTSGSATTSLFFSNCWVEAFISYGYQLQNAYYCQLAACAADGYTATPKALGGYAFINCEGVTLTGCGVEKTQAGMQCNESKGLTFISCGFAAIDLYGVKISGVNYFTMIGCCMLNGETTPIALVSASSDTYNIIGCEYVNISIDGSTTEQTNQNHIYGLS